MTPVFAVLLAIIAVFAIGYPYLRKNTGGQRGLNSRLGVEIFDQPMNAELESDYRTGILTKEEYDELSGSMAQSTQETSVPAGDAVGGTEEDDEVERRVRALRQKTPSNVEVPRRAPASQRPQQSRKPKRVGQGNALACPKCGSPYRTGDRFCTECGTRLRGGGR